MMSRNGSVYSPLNDCLAASQANRLLVRDHRAGRGPDLFAAWRASISETDEVSSRTLQTPRRWDLETEYRKHPPDACPSSEMAQHQTRICCSR